MRLLRAVALLLGGLGGALLLLLALALIRPSLFLNSATLSWALTRWGAVYQPRWERLSLEVGSPSLLSKNIFLEARGLCLSHPQGAWAGCIEGLEGRFALRLSPRRMPELTVILLEVDGDHVRVDRTALAKGGKKSLPAPARRRSPPYLNGGLGWLRLEEVRVRLPDTSVKLSATSQLEADARLDFSRWERRPLTLFVDALWRASGSPKAPSVLVPETAGRGMVPAASGVEQKARVEILADSDIFSQGRLTYLESRARLIAPGKGQARLDARARRSGGDIVFDASGEAKASGRSLSMEVHAVRRQRKPSGLPRAGKAAGVSARSQEEEPAYPSEVGGRAWLRLADARGPLRRGALEDCALQAFLSAAGALERASVACGYWAEPAALRSREGRVKGKAQVRAQRRPRRGPDYFQADALVTLDPYRDWYEFQGQAEARVSGRVGNLETLRFRHKARFNAQVASFSNLVAFLKDTRYAVPAPLHVLEGPLVLQAASGGGERQEPLRLDWTLSSDLASRRQKLKARVQGNVAILDLATPRRGFQAVAEAALDDVVLELPYLGVKGLPKLVVDRRISAGPSEFRDVPRGAGPPFSLQARIHTPERPVRLLSNLAADPIPIGLDLRLTRPPPQIAGTISVQEFDVELFRRRATVDHLRVIQRRGSKVGDLDGLILYKTAEATIKIMLLGNTAKPRVELDSDPPMHRQQILAVLLYGKSPSMLESEEAATVGNVDAALTTQAFGLASLFLFASTPVEFVGYDPAAQSYTVRFRLPGGASMELGSDLEESRHLRLRKRLSRHWALETELRRQEEDNLATTFLEWFNRY